MSITITPVHDPDSADRAGGVFDIAFDNNYTANGYVVTADQFNRRAVYSLIPVQTGAGSRLLTYDATSDTTGKLRIWTALGTEATGASDQSTISCRCRVVGPRL